MTSVQLLYQASEYGHGPCVVTWRTVARLKSLIIVVYAPVDFVEGHMPIKFRLLAIKTQFIT